MFGGRFRRGLLGLALIAANTAAMSAVRPHQGSANAPVQGAVPEAVGAGWWETAICVSCIAGGMAVVYSGIGGYALVIGSANFIGPALTACVLACGIAYADFAS